MPGSNSSDARALPEAAPQAPGHLLDLAVHALPEPGGELAAGSTSRGRWKMLFILAVCAAPVVASYFTFYVVRPQSHRSYGELIAEQPALPDLVARQLDGGAVRLPSLAGQWLLVSVAGGACGADCEQRLYLQRQLRESLGKERDRLDWVWLVDDEAPVAATLQPALAQATVLRLPAADIARWLQPEAGHRLTDHLYLVDPLGHWMMRFPAAMDMAGAAKAKRDLDRLLRAAASWDREGR
ncbi:hypothetical protein GT347_16340 [Xylophilus rhododendri]|uniref:Transmembrane protein n=1 Tax=Xylophilus rhododendri TaxID=2697032 RepID=A0A857J9J1_9BURK|nr:hypothetical protein [Xylophilus rhododendri]QHI99408.1 hypothetical protein GT347_16340 [Xylophilus rhododendri]